MTPEVGVPSVPRLHVEGMMHRESIAVSEDFAEAHALLKVFPSGPTPEPFPLDLVLVLDISGSMYGEDGTGRSRIDRVRDAASAAIEALRPSDRLAVVAFGLGARTLLPLTPLARSDLARDVIRKIDTSDVDQSGTAMDKGIGLALDAIGDAPAPGRIARVLVVTDGETEREAHCRELAERAGRAGVRLTVMGFGTGWNSAFVKDLVALNGGRWSYIDAETPDAARQAFLSEFGRLAATRFADLELTLRPAKDVRAERVWQTVPDVREIRPDVIEDRLLTADLGDLGDLGAGSVRYILSLKLPRRPDGRYVIARARLEYRTVTGSGTADEIALEIAYTESGPGYMTAEPARQLDEIRIFQLNSDLQSAIGVGDLSGARRLAGLMARQGEAIGPRGETKARLARQVLEEIEGTGRVCRKTRIAVDDAARIPEAMPE